MLKSVHVFAFLSFLLVMVLAFVGCSGPYKDEHGVWRGEKVHIAQNDSFVIFHLHSSSGTASDIPACVLDAADQWKKNHPEFRIIGCSANMDGVRHYSLTLMIEKR